MDAMSLCKPLHVFSKDAIAGCEFTANVDSAGRNGKCQKRRKTQHMTASRRTMETATPAAP
jgi:hypothetical protein